MSIVGIILGVDFSKPGEGGEENDGEFSNNKSKKVIYYALMTIAVGHAHGHGHGHSHGHNTEGETGNY